MMHLKTILILFCLLIGSSVIGQNKLILKHREKVNRKKKLKRYRTYIIRTTNNTYSSKILSYTDTTISVNHMAEVPDKAMDTNDTTPANMAWVNDTSIVHMKDIVSVEQHWVDSELFFKVFAWFVMAAALHVAILPVMAINRGSDGLEEWAMNEGIIIGASAPPLLLAITVEKLRPAYDLTSKWKMETQ